MARRIVLSKVNADSLFGVNEVRQWRNKANVKFSELSLMYDYEEPKQISPFIVELNVTQGSVFSRSADERIVLTVKPIDDDLPALSVVDKKLQMIYKDHFKERNLPSSLLSISVQGESRINVSLNQDSKISILLPKVRTIVVSRDKVSDGRKSSDPSLHNNYEVHKIEFKDLPRLLLNKHFTCSLILGIPSLMKNNDSSYIKKHVVSCFCWGLHDYNEVNHHMSPLLQQYLRLYPQTLLPCLPEPQTDQKDSDECVLCEPQTDQKDSVECVCEEDLCNPSEEDLCVCEEDLCDPSEDVEPQQRCKKP